MHFVTNKPLSLMHFEHEAETSSDAGRKSFFIVGNNNDNNGSDTIGGKNNGNNGDKIVTSLAAWHTRDVAGRSSETANCTVTI